MDCIFEIFHSLSPIDFALDLHRAVSFFTAPHKSMIIYQICWEKNKQKISTTYIYAYLCMRVCIIYVYVFVPAVH